MNLSNSSDKALKIVFAGTPDFAASILESLIANDHQIVAAYCQPDRQVGRGKKLAFGPVKSLAVEQGIPVEQPIKFDQQTDEQGLTALEKLKNYQPDLMIVVAYGLILPQSVLDVPTFGCINIHASLLPRWRGAAPIQRAIEHADNQTGITIMQMDKGLDTGNMLLSEKCEIASDDTGSTLHDKLAHIGQDAINQFLVSVNHINGSSLSPGTVQNNEHANYAHKLTKSEAEIDWNQTATLIEQKIRAFNAWPVSFSYVGNNRLRIWQAHIAESTEDETTSEPPLAAGRIIKFDKHGIQVACGDRQSLIITQLQADGSRSMSAAEFLNAKSQWFIDHPSFAKLSNKDSVN